MPAVVIDTSIVLRLVLPSQRDPTAEALWQLYAWSDTDIVIPSQGVSEAMAQVRRHVSRGRLSQAEGDRVFGELRAVAAFLRIEKVQLEAWEVAKQYNRPDTYDCEFYALAEGLGTELWTADMTFVNAMGQTRPAWVKRLTDFQSVG